MPRKGTFAAGLIILAALDSLSWPSPAFAAEPARFSIVIQNRRVSPQQQTIRTTQGELLELAFTADELVELHLHGYDLIVTASPGSVAVMRLHAKTAGRFPIEGHSFGSGTGRSRRHIVLLYLEIHPR